MIRVAVDKRSRKFLARLGAVFLASVAPVGLQAAVAPSRQPTVTIADGFLAGATDAGADRFLAIPYAAPPIDELRWMPPMPPQPWHGPRDATSFASKCPQNGWIAPNFKYRSEDCLYLNVYRPAAARADAKLPVIFWIHGGAFVTGASQDVDGAVLAAKQNVVVVTINYRLGALGFAAIRQLQEQHPDLPMANFGLQDQQAALRWTQKNITAFGGDPANVTIIGQSAGGGSVWFLLVSPASAGLFKGAIAMSASRAGGARTVAAETKTGLSSKMVGALGCGEVTDVPACLRSKSVDDVYAAGGGFYTRSSGWGGMVDGRIIPDDPGKLLAEGKFQHVPIITGFVAQNEGFFVQWRQMNGVDPWTADDYAGYLKALPHGDALANAYPPSAFKNADWANIAVASDQHACETLKQGAVAAQTAPGVYLYDFDDPDAASTIFHSATINGPFHASDVPYLFGRGFPNEAKPAAPNWTTEQAALSTRIMTYFANFARTGTPGSGWKPGVIETLAPAGDQAQPAAAFAAAHHCDLFD